VGQKRGSEVILFVTGKLAEPSLRRVLADLQVGAASSGGPSSYDVAVMKITVAALMTTEWIAKFLEVPSGTDLVLIPGLCEGDPGVIAERHGVRVEKGPKDVREIPRYFGRAAAARDYGDWDIEILAEINNAPKLSHDAIRAQANYFRDSGADIIDIGCTPGLAFPSLGAVVRDLVESGLRVSVDSFEPDEIGTAVAAGAELVLSVNGANIEVARDLVGTGARVVVLPDLGGSLDTLEPSLVRLEQWGVPYLIDPILEPIGFGFRASLEPGPAASTRTSPPRASRRCSTPSPPPASASPSAPASARSWATASRPSPRMPAARPATASWPWSGCGRS
jgi:hypothetical protein